MEILSKQDKVWMDGLRELEGSIDHIEDNFEGYFEKKVFPSMVRQKEKKKKKRRKTQRNETLFLSFFSFSLQDERGKKYS